MAQTVAFSGKDERLFMKKAYPASEMHKRVLKYTPDITHCLLGRDLETINNLSDTVVFIWLINGHGYWYHIQYVNGNTLIGYALNAGWWYYAPINKKQISRYY